KAGSTAADGDSVHSPFTSALLQHIATPGLDLRIALGRVRDEVLKNTANRQEPFVYGSLGGADGPLGSGTGDAQPEARPDIVGAQTARDYEAAAKVGTKEAWDAFLSRYPVGFYAELAKAQRAKLIASLPAKTSKPAEPKAKGTQTESKG